MGWQDRDYARDVSGPGTRGPKFRLPAFSTRSIVTTLIMVNVAVFVLQSLFPPLHELLSGSIRRAPLGGVTIHHGIAEMWARGVWRGEIWRLFTAQYLHAGFWHIAFNMIGLHFLGRPIEQMWSRRMFFTIYSLAGLFGNLFFTLLAARNVINPDVPAVGASGCILGLLGIMAVKFPNARIFVFPIPFPLKIRTVAFVLAGIAFFVLVERGANYGGEACHLAGLGFGTWWAMKGEAWWAMRKVRMPRTRVARKVTRPKGFKARIAERREDAEIIDRILRKVYDGGVHSLSDAEKKALQEATDRQQKREQEAGRVDRL